MTSAFFLNKPTLNLIIIEKVKWNIESEGKSTPSHIWQKYHNIENEIIEDNDINQSVMRARYWFDHIRQDL